MPSIDTQQLHILQEVLESLPVGIVAYDTQGRVVYRNRLARETIGASAEELAEPGSFDRVGGPRRGIHKRRYGETVVITQREAIKPNAPGGDALAAVDVLFRLDELEEIIKETDAYQTLLMDMKAIFENSWDVIYVSEGSGTTLRVSSACERLWGLRQEDLVGKTVFELERNGVFSPSITRLVLEAGKRVTALQTTITGRRLLVVGTPIKDESGRIVRVVNASRDITEQERLQQEVEQVRELSERYKQELLKKQKEQSEKLIFRSEQMRAVIAYAQRAAEVDSTVLLLGETGVGKEVLASALHHWSPRKDGPFIQINCAAIPEALLESELFGYHAGAFTGAAKKGKAGLMELAHEGTLFLDEIAELPPKLQAKLLRVLQEKTVVRLGGTTPIPVDMRVLAATNRDLQREVREGRFREDLYYRLNVVPIQIPPLRERRDDIAPLFFHFLNRFNTQYLQDKAFSREAFDCLLKYDWPGNVRELQNIIERLVVTTEQPTITAEDVPEAMRGASNPELTIDLQDVIPLKEALESVERKLVELALRKYGTTTAAAKVLGVDQSTISRKIKRLGIQA